MHRQVSIVFEGIDLDTPINEKLCAKYTKSFAYYTVKDRLPIILTKVINELATNKGEILQQPVEGAEEDLKSVIGKISKLKNELVTNKPFIKLCSKGDDVDEWNNYLESQIVKGDKPPCWFYSPWLYAENYMYRRLWEVFETSETLKDYDPFLNQKEDAFEVSLPDIKILGKFTLSQCDSTTKDAKQKFIEFLKLSLWSNRCDLSLSNGEQLSEENLNLSNINDLDSFLLCDDSDKAYNLLTHCQNGVIDFVNDNSSYEVFSDFCFCDMLCSLQLVSKINFHVKKIPWYVSDVMKKDISWLLEKLEKNGLGDLSSKWKKYFQDGTWSVFEENYWTLPFDYSDMKMRNSHLLNSLKTSNLIIFKGDLNYRKLLGDIAWDPFEEFEVALREFKPTNILSLRTVKADLICGITNEKYKNFTENDKMWMRSGKYGIIQFYRGKQNSNPILKGKEETRKKN